MKEFILPDIGEGIVECELLEWLVAEGDVIAEDQPVAEVMTDKATVQIPAMYAGKVTKLHYKTGEIAKVHAPLFAMEVASEEVVTDKLESNNMVSGKALASPAVRRVAKEMGIDLSEVQGSGKKGRVLKEDLVVTQPQTSFIPKPKSAEPIRGLKAAMLKQMNDSVNTIPHFSVSDECQMDALLALKEVFAPEFADRQIKWSLLPFYCKALSLTLHEYPILNSRVSLDEKEILYIDSHNIGIAIATDSGLVVPNIKNVQQKTILQLAEEIDKTIHSAKNNTLSPDAFKDGTITISNIGPIGGVTATPVINHPEVAIVALGKMQKLPRFNQQDEIVAQTLMTVNWSGDHRIIDGATMVKFNNAWMRYLEQPVLMLSELR